MKKAFIILCCFLSVNLSYAQWSLIPTQTTRNFFDITFVDSLKGFLVGYEIFMKTTDGGNTWENCFYFSSNSVTNIKFPTPDVGYAAGDYIILKSTDGGDTWNYINTGTSNVIRGIYFHSADTGFLCGQGEEIWRTVDGGNTWTQQVQGLGFWLRRFSFPVHDTGYCVGDGHTIYKTVDGGESWNYLIGSGSPNLAAVTFLNPEIGYVAGHEGYIAKTIDGGLTWQQLNTGTSLNFEGGLWAIDEMTVYAAGENGIILRTDDGGLSWNVETAPTTTYLRGICFLPSGKGFICGHDGTLLVNECNTTSFYTYEAQSLTVDFTNKSICANIWWWDFGDGYYSDLKNPWHIYDAPGEYIVCLKATDTVTMHNDIYCDTIELFPTGISGLDNLCSFYPNPCSHTLFVKISGNTRVDQLCFYNSLGVKVSSEPVQSGGLKTTQIRIDLPDGLYLVAGLAENQLVFQKKLIIRNE